MSLALIIGLTFFACSGGVSVISTELYDGESPNGDSAIVDYVFDCQIKGYRGLKIEISVNNFGDIPNVNADDPEQVSKEFVKYAKLGNKARYFYTGPHYYYTYSAEKFEPKKRCVLTFYYMVSPMDANKELKFIFDYNVEGAKHRYVKSKCDVFKPRSTINMDKLHIN